MQRLNFADINIQHILIFSAIILGAILGIYIGYNGASKLIIGGLLGAIFFVLSIMRPWVAVAAFFALIPLENLFVLQGSLTATLSKLMGAYLIFLVIITGSLKYIHEVFINKKVLVLVLYGALGIISVAVSKHKDYGIPLLITLWLYIFLYFVFIIMIRDIKTLYYATWALLAGGIISIISPYFFGFGRVGGYELKRYGGLWGDQNEFAALLLVLIPLSIMNFFMDQKLIYKVISAITSLILLTGLILTYSRGGFISLFLMLVLAMFKIVSGKNRTKILAISVPCIIVAFIIFYYAFADQFLARMETLSVLSSSESAQTEGSLKQRYFYYFQLAPKLFMQHPVFGVGFREFVFSNPYGQVTHNTYLEVLVGMGVIGFIPFVAILFLSWKDLRSAQKFNNNNPFVHSYAVALEIGFLGYLFASMFLTLDLNKVLWMSIALTSVVLNLSRIYSGTQTTNKVTNRNYKTLGVTYY